MHTAAAVRTGMVQSMRGEVHEFVSSIGFETSMEDIIEKIEKRFGECWMADRLQQEKNKKKQCMPNCSVRHWMQRRRKGWSQKLPL